jgi:hypothetical protein
MLQHDVPLRAAARAIYQTCLDDGAALTFEQAERLRTPRYRKGVDAAAEARAALVQAQDRQLELI